MNVGTLRGGTNGVSGVCGRCLEAAANPPQCVQDLGLAAGQLLAVR